MRAEASVLPLRLCGLGYAARGAWLLRDVTLTVAAHRRLVILGPNGAGKSLLLRLCHGLLRPSAGSVEWALPERAAAQAMVFQRPVLLRRSVRANLDHALYCAGLDGRRRAPRVEETLDRFGLGRIAGQPARLLSGGEQQRLALARAWGLRPQVLFLDEPSSHLDPGSTRTIEFMLHDFAAEGMTIVMTTHDLGQARRLGEDVAFLNRGRLIEHGSAERFFASPSTIEARAFLAGDLIW